MLVVLLRFLGHIYYNFFTTQFTLFSVQFNECLTTTHISYATTTITPKLSYHKLKECEVSHKRQDGLTNTNLEIPIKATMPSQI